MKKDRKRFIRGFKNYFSAEIAIEYKACLYFFVILVFYCGRWACQGIFQASMLHMCEIILTTYLMGYLQVYLMGNFDEADSLGKKEIFFILLCMSLYSGAAWLFGWFGRDWKIMAGFAAYIVFAYWCAYLVNRIKRSIDTENLNNMLAEYKKMQGQSFMTAMPEEKDKAEEEVFQEGYHDE